jgi:hypothetical protein
MNILSPGMIDSPLWSKVDDASRQSLFGRIAESVPAQVMGQPDDIANAVTFLLTTPFATGSTAAVRSRDVIDHVEWLGVTCHPPNWRSPFQKRLPRNCRARNLRTGHNRWSTPAASECTPEATSQKGCG